MRFAGSWQVVGSRSFSDDYISFPSLTLDADDNPYAAYFDNGLQQVIVQRYDAASTSWVKLGGAIFNDVSEVSVAVDRLGVPYAAYNGNQKLTVVKWDGTSWAVVANTEFADGLHISLAIAQDNFPYVSFLDRNSRLAKVMTIMPIHVPADQPTLAATATSTCAGETTQLSIRTGNLNEAAAWVWYSGDCDTGTRLGTGLTLDVAPTVTTTYYALSLIHI